METIPSRLNKIKKKFNIISFMREDKNGEESFETYKTITYNIQ